VTTDLEREEALLRDLTGAVPAPRRARRVAKEAPRGPSGWLSRHRRTKEPFVSPGPAGWALLAHLERQRLTDEVRRRDREVRVADIRRRLDEAFGPVVTVPPDALVGVPESHVRRVDLLLAAGVTAALVLVGWLALVVFVGVP
jgi:hypothetical protein